MTSSPDTDKTRLRAALKAARAEAHARDPDAGEAIAERFTMKLFDRFGPVVAGYWPIRDEVDPRPLMARLAHAGAKLCLPCVEADDTMVFRAWAEGDTLEKGRMGLMQPAAGKAVLVPSLLLVPLLGFDLMGNRIGYGKGHYDRALEALRLTGRAFACGLAFEVQLVDSLVSEPHDQPLDWVVTPDRNHPVMLARAAGS